MRHASEAVSFEAPLARGLPARESITRAILICTRRSSFRRSRAAAGANSIAYRTGESAEVEFPLQLIPRNRTFATSLCAGAPQCRKIGALFYFLE